MYSESQYISEKFSGRGPLVSVEFFPPKDEEGAQRIERTAAAIKPFGPDFVSITYGAGGSSRERTRQYGEILKDRHGYDVMPHLTCVGHSRAELREIIGGYCRAGFKNILALRGDPPKGQASFAPHPDGLSHASELVALIRGEFPQLCIGVAGYPETHPEARSPEEDLRHLKEKVDAGASFISTQLFFDNRKYFDFVARCRAAGIGVPILPGLMPALSLKQARNFCGSCKAGFPQELAARLEAAGEDPLSQSAVGIEWARGQIKGLLAGGAPGFHLYLLNRRKPALALLGLLRADGLLPRARPADKPDLEESD